MTADDSGRVRVIRYRGFPLELHVATMRRFEAMRREIAIVVDGSADVSAVAPHILEVLRYARLGFASMNPSVGDDFTDAIARGEETIDFELEVTGDTALLAGAFDDLLDELDEYCREGDLLIGPEPPEISALRKWWLHEIAQQAQGHPPTPWREWRDGGVTRS